MAAAPGCAQAEATPDSPPGAGEGRVGPSGSAGRAPSCSPGLWWEVQPSARSPPLSLPVSDQEHLDEEINNLRKELRVKVNRLFEAQGKRSGSGTFCLSEQMSRVRRVQKLLSSGCSCSLSLTPSLLPLWSCHPPGGETGSTPQRPRTIPGLSLPSPQPPLQSSRGSFTRSVTTSRVLRVFSQVNPS